MILSEMLYAFRNDLELEYVKRQIPKELQFKLIDKQLKLIFSKVISDLQKEFKMIMSSQTIVTVAGEQAYALTRDFMTLDSAFLDGGKLELKTLGQIYDGQSGYAIKMVSSYLYIILSPAPSENNVEIVVKSYNDMKLFSVNDGLDSDSAGTDVQYMKIPTQYDAAVLMGMMSNLFDDRLPLYEKEKLRLRGLRFMEQKIEYDMTGVNDDFPKTTSSYNSDADGTPSTIPADPVIT